MNIDTDESIEHGRGELIDHPREAHRIETIEIQKERIGLAKYITAMSLGVSTGIYIFIGAAIGVAENMGEGVSLAGALILFLDDNRLTVILICALAAFLMTIVMGVVVILNHIKNWGNVDKPYNYSEWSMIGFAFLGVSLLLAYLLVISWDAAAASWDAATGPIGRYVVIFLAGALIGGMGIGIGVGASELIFRALNNKTAFTHAVRGFIIFIRDMKLGDIKLRSNSFVRNFSWNNRWIRNFLRFLFNRKN